MQIKPHPTVQNVKMFSAGLKPAKTYKKQHTNTGEKNKKPALFDISLKNGEI